MFNFAQKMWKLGSNMMGIALYCLFNFLIMMMAHFYLLDISFKYYQVYRSKTLSFFQCLGGIYLGWTLMFNYNMAV